MEEDSNKSKRIVNEYRSKYELQLLEIEDLRYQIEKLKGINNSLSKALEAQVQLKSVDSFIQEEIQKLNKNHEKEIQDIKSRLSEQLKLEEEKFKNLQLKYNELQDTSKKQIKYQEERIKLQQEQIIQLELKKKETYKNQIEEAVEMASIDLKIKLANQEQNSRQQFEKINQENKSEIQKTKEHFIKLIQSNQIKIQELQNRIEDSSKQLLNEQSLNQKLESLCKEKDTQYYKIKDEKAEMDHKIQHYEEQIYA